MALADSIRRRWASLKQERTSWEAHWREIDSFISPRTARFLQTDRNRGQKSFGKILDSTATRAHRILAAGLMAGATSPARPWFRLAPADQDLAKSSAVKLWMSDAGRVVQDLLQRSNAYRALHAAYENLGSYATFASFMMDDHEKVIHHYPSSVGEYALAGDFKGRVNLIYRGFEKTVEELVGEFGLDAVSPRVRNLYDRGNYDTPIPVLHALEPRKERDPTRRDARNMPFRSVYLEEGAPDGKLLRESGMRWFRALCPRWNVTPGDVYGSNSPAMEALGDTKQLQQQQMTKGQAIEYMAMPPIVMPLSAKDQRHDFLPGGEVYVDTSASVKPAFEVRLDLNHLGADIQDVRNRINQAFFVDMFLMMANDTRSGITATEVAERHEEKLLMLGPVLERLHNELLEPLVEQTFLAALEAGLLSPPPEELQGQELNIEFVSMLAQAQRAIGVNSMDRFVTSLGAIAQAKPSVLDKFDEDQYVDLYSDMLGVPPEIVVSSERVALIRQQRAQAAQQQAQTEQMAQAAQAVRNLGSANTSGDTALGGLMRQFSGYD